MPKREVKLQERGINWPWPLLGGFRFEVRSEDEVVELQAELSTSM